MKLPSICRWFEPLGQMIVLAAFGFQFFQVIPAADTSSRASAAYTQALIERLEVEQSSEGLKGIEADKARVNIQDKRMDAEDEHAQSEKEKKNMLIVYILLYALGSTLAITGKFASVAYSTKSLPARSA